MNIGAKINIHVHNFLSYTLCISPGRERLEPCTFHSRVAKSLTGKVIREGRKGEVETYLCRGSRAWGASADSGNSHLLGNRDDTLG